MKKIHKLVLIFTAAVIIILFALGIIFKSEFTLLLSPKSYVLLCMEETLEQDWREIIKIYNTSMGFQISALRDEEEVLSMNAYNDKNKLILSSPQLSDNSYIGFSKRNGKKKTGNSDSENADGTAVSSENSNTGSTQGRTGAENDSDKNKNIGKDGETLNEEIPSLIEIYKKYATVTKKGKQSFALVNSEDSICETDEFEITLDQDILSLVPKYLEKFIDDKNLLKEVNAYLDKVNSDITIDIFIDDANIIRDIKMVFNYDDEDALAEITFNDGKKYLDNLTATYILGKESATVKSIGNHSGEGNQFTDDTSILILSGAMTKAKLASTASIDFNTESDNVAFKVKGDFFNFPISLEGTGDLQTGEELTFQADMDLELKFEEYQIDLSMDKKENELKSVKTFDSIGSLNDVEKHFLRHWLQGIL